MPNGGWLDGCLNVLAGVEVLRRLAEDGTSPPVTVRLVDWADEEGARFGRSLFGSSAASGTMADQDELRELADKDGNPLPDDARARTASSSTARSTRTRSSRTAGAYLELHIEQGPVLEDLGLPLGVVLGTYGVERHAVRFTGQSAHAGSTPMDRRRDALAAAAKLALEIRPIAVRHGGVCTVGRVVTKPGIVTAVVGECEHPARPASSRRGLAGRDAGRGEGRERAVRGRGERRGRMGADLADRADPVRPRADRLRATRRSRTSPAASHRLPSGPLHDAAEVARAGIPTVMVFVQSLRGLSHTKLEDTKPEHLELAVEALDRLASETIDWLAARG